MSEKNLKKLGRPASPEEIKLLHQETTPDFVYNAVNYLLAKNGSVNSITLTQKAIVEEILLRSVAGVDGKTIFSNGWLNIEDAYRKAGWDVEYDKPGYNESYEPYFVFTPKLSD